LKPGEASLIAQFAEYLAGRKIPKTLSGIETPNLFSVCSCGSDLSRKIPKTLSGIETFYPLACIWVPLAAKYLKPYQGLKPDGGAYKSRNGLAAKYLKPYQGLKRMPFIFANNLSALLSRKIPKTLSGIETTTL